MTLEDEKDELIQFIMTFSQNTGYSDKEKLRIIHEKTSITHIKIIKEKRGIK